MLQSLRYTASGVAEVQQAGVVSHEQSQMQSLFSMTWACEPVSMHKVMLQRGCISEIDPGLIFLKPM